MSPGYLETLGLAIRQGRSFNRRARTEPLAAVINEALARRLWPDGSAVGRTFSRSRQDGDRIEVIGVIADAEMRPAGARSRRSTCRFRRSTTSDA
jgi:hypothetical protein